MAEVFFNGETRCINVIQVPSTANLISLEAQRDIYSEWKRWMVSSGGTKYEMAFRTIGGDTLTPELRVGSYFFIQNQTYTVDGGIGWHIEPYEADHEMEIFGNLYKEDITKNIFKVSTGGTTFTVLIRLETSSLTQLAEVGQPEAVADAVWEHTERTLTDITAGDISSIQSKLDLIIGDVAEMQVKLNATTAGIDSIDIELDYLSDKIDLTATSAQIVSLETLVLRILGLSQENFRVKNQVYKDVEIEGQTRYFLESATIWTYANATDCNNDVNPIAQYDMIATYDVLGRCTLYKVERTA